MKRTAIPKAKATLITEFVVQAYRDRIEWGGLNHFLWWLIHRVPKESWLPYARRINRFGLERGRSPRSK